MRSHLSVQIHDTEETNVSKKRSVFHSHRGASCLVASRFAASGDQRGGPGCCSQLPGRHTSATTPTAATREHRNVARGWHTSATTPAATCKGGNAASGRYTSTTSAVAHKLTADWLIRIKGEGFRGLPLFVLRFAQREPDEVIARIIIGLAGRCRP